MQQTCFANSSNEPFINFENSTHDETLSHPQVTWH